MKDALNINTDTKSMALQAVDENTPVEALKRSTDSNYRYFFAVYFVVDETCPVW